MISILPHASETLVTVYSRHEVTNRLSEATTEDILTQNMVRRSTVRFTGIVREDRFQFSIKVTRPNSFLPQVKGSIDEASSGCLIYLRYGLFKSTRVYLVFWLCFVLLAGAVVYRQYAHAPVLLTIPLAIDGLILWIAWANFKLQLRLTRDVLRQVLR